MTFGILLAVAAMLLWGFGDFYIQRSARSAGDWETVFVISLMGSIIFLPFVYGRLPGLIHLDRELLLLIAVSVALLVASLLTFEGLKEGKIAVVEPLYALEIPVAGILAFLLLGESIAFHQTILISLLTLGLILVSLKSRHFSKKAWLEQGAVIGAAGSIVMGLSSFLIGLSSRQSDPILTTWFMSAFLAVAAFLYLLSKGRLKSMMSDLKKDRYPLFSSGLSDNLAWIAYAFALSLSPMAITVALVECSIIISALLGIYVNKERVLAHQKVGLALSIVSAVVLAAGAGK